MSNFALKLVAIVSMLIDHIGYEFFPVQSVWRAIGRLAFPIFAFLIVEGYYHTHSKIEYLIRLGAFGIISEVPYDLLFRSSYIDLSTQNVYFTLFLGLLSICIFEWFKDGGKYYWIIGLLFSVGLIIIAELCRTDYGAYGVIMVMLFYILRSNKEILSLVFILLVLSYVLLKPSDIMLYEIAALPIIYLYNGKKGYNSSIVKYGFYAFYPLHLLIIAYIGNNIPILFF